MEGGVYLIDIFISCFPYTGGGEMETITQIHFIRHTESFLNLHGVCYYDIFDFPTQTGEK